MEPCVVLLQVSGGALAPLRLSAGLPGTVRVSRGSFALFFNFAVRGALPPRSARLELITRRRTGQCNADFAGMRAAAGARLRFGRGTGGTGGTTANDGPDFMEPGPSKHVRGERSFDRAKRLNHFLYQTKHSH